MPLTCTFLTKSIYFEIVLYTSVKKMNTYLNYTHLNAKSIYINIEYASYNGNFLLFVASALFFVSEIEIIFYQKEK